MDFYSEKDFSKIIKHNAQSLRHDKLSQGTDVMRIYDRNLIDFPVTVDLYASYARVVDFGDKPFSDEEKAKCLDLISRFAYVDVDKIVYLYRAKLDKSEQHEKNDAEPVIVNVKEGGLAFKTNLSSYTDSGLFLDHANTRAFVKENSCGKDVLNLFSYTGSFSVYAASGLAKTVTSVDLSATYTKWAEENLALNGFEGEPYQCVCMDAMKFIRSRIEDKTKYDIIIFDPPSFSNSHKMEHDFDVQRDHVYWLRLLAGIVRKDGFIIFSTNLSGFRIDKKALKGLNIRDITAQMWADGFVKDRKGTVRSWMMSIDDDSLSIDWSEDSKPSEVREGHREERKRPRESREGRKFSEDRPRRRYSDSEGRRYGDRPRRSFDDRPRAPRFRDSEERPRRRYEDSESYGYGRRYSESRPKRNYDDRSETGFERRHQENFEEREGGFSSRRYEDRPRRSFDERPRAPRFRDREERSYGDRSGRDSGKQSERDFRKASGRASAGSSRRDSFKEKSEYKRPEGSSSRREKPYGFESFKPARNRNDSSDFFWNSDDIKTDK